MELPGCRSSDALRLGNISHGRPDEPSSGRLYPRLQYILYLGNCAARRSQSFFYLGGLQPDGRFEVLRFVIITTAQIVIMTLTAWPTYQRRGQTGLDQRTFACGWRGK